MIALVDASVAIKWFHSAGETEVGESTALLSEHLAGTLELQVLDLTPYEVGNSLLRRHRWPPDRAAVAVDSLLEAHPLVTPDPVERRYAAALAARHGLSYYDATYAAVADARHLVLVTADRELLDGFGRSATEVAASL